MPVVDLRVLGPLELVVDGGPVALPSKQRALLAALLVGDGRARSVDELSDAVWGEAVPPSGRKLVQVYVSQLRKLLPDEARIVTRGGSYSLEVSPDVLDAARMERLVGDSASARRAGNHVLAASLAGQALSLWRGRPYGDLGYEDFARAECERLEELRLVATEERLDAELAVGRHAGVLGEIRGLAAENPTRERLHEQAMLALYRCGRQSEALDHYADVRRTLRDELGLEPGPSLRELQQRILRQDPDLDLDGSPHGDDPSPLPSPPDRLVGRARELAALREILARRESRLVVLTGAGGSGKTRLALEAAREAAGSFANGAVLVELASLRDPALVAPTIAAALDVHDAPEEPAVDTIARALAPRELLLVIDNAEHLRGAAPLYVDLVARAPRLTVLVTSRAVLHVSGEQVFPVAPLADDDAAELFEIRARALDPSFARTPGNDHDVREICRRIDGLPLAIELAAARVRSLGLRSLKERLDVRLPLLGGGPHDLPARQRTLAETVDWSVDLLSDAHRAVFVRLAVLPGGASLEAAEAVCGADLDSLEELVDGNLVVRLLDGDGRPRFAMLETIREYALALLGGDRADAERSLAAYVAELVTRAELKGPAQAEWLRRLDAETDNLRAALDVAGGIDGELELRIAGRLWRYWWIRGALSEGLARIEAALDRDAGPATAVRAHALQGGAGLAYSRGDYVRAKELAHEAIAVAVATGAKWDEASANTVLGVVANAEGDFASARRHLERNLELSEAWFPDEAITAKLNLGNTLLETGDFEGAARLFADVLDAHRRNGIDEGIGFAALNLGLARYRLGETESARESFVEARSAFASLGFRAHVAHAVQGLAAVDAATGRPGAAARRLGAAAAELDEVGWSEDDFEATLAKEVEGAVRDAIGDDAFAAAYGQGRADGTLQ